ncbi:MAG: ATP-binding protein [Spirochaetales bacterium]|nr:ATP-binding protein [Spirochaetales bacterium]
MMILEFSVKNYKSIKEKAVISFEATSDTTGREIHCVSKGNKAILKLAAFYGPNASGKTNILIAFDFFRDFIVNSFVDLKPGEQTGYIPFLFDEATKNGPGLFNIVFFPEEIRYEYTLELNKMEVVYEKLTFSPKGQKRLLFERIKKTTEPIYEYNWGASLGGNKKEISDMTRENVPFLTTAAQLSHPLLSKVYLWFQEKCLPIVQPVPQGLANYTITLIEQDETNKKEILSLLNRVDFGPISEIKIEKKKIDKSILRLLPEDVREKIQKDDSKAFFPEIFFKHQYGKGESFLSLEEESRGTQRFFELLGPLLTLIVAQGFLIIDELDSSMHPELLSYFLQAFLENSDEAQMIFTSHNPDLLDSGLLRRDEIWFTEKDTDGGSIYTCLSDYKGVRKEGSLRKQYLSGRYGALPITEPYYKRDNNIGPE